MSYDELVLEFQASLFSWLSQTELLAAVRLDAVVRVDSVAVIRLSEA